MIREGETVLVRVGAERGRATEAVERARIGQEQRAARGFGANTIAHPILSDAERFAILSAAFSEVCKANARADPAWLRSRILELCACGIGWLQRLPEESASAAPAAP